MERTRKLHWNPLISKLMKIRPEALELLHEDSKADTMEWTGAYFCSPFLRRALRLSEFTKLGCFLHLSHMFVNCSHFFIYRNVFMENNHHLGPSEYFSELIHCLRLSEHICGLKPSHSSVETFFLSTVTLFFSFWRCSRSKVTISVRRNMCVQ
jgi:hypothetical protein